MTDEYIYSLEKRIQILEEKLTKKAKRKNGSGVDFLINKIKDAGSNGVAPSIILRSKYADLFEKRIAETKEVFLMIRHRTTAGRPIYRYVYSCFAK